MYGQFGGIPHPTSVALLTGIAALPEGASYAALERNPDICSLVQSDLVVFENTRPGVGEVRLTFLVRSC